MSFTLLCLGKVDWATGRFAEAEANFRAALAVEKKAGSKAHPLNAITRLINFLIVRQQFVGAAQLLEQYGKIANLSVVNRAWHFSLKTALSEAVGKPDAEKRVLLEMETAIGDSTIPDAAMYRARAVVFADGNVTRELERLDDLLQSGIEGEGILMARTACALRLEKPEAALETLDRIKSPLDVDPKSQLRVFFKILAVFRREATDPHRKELHVALELAETYLETTKDLKAPEIGGYSISNQVELRWWCQQIRREWKNEGE